ncbi:MAG TPA: magnesium and cobalt transport protein CorA, partial [Marmoricola sp.]|nr:magnesium and cobalt transport protein CorA [Marmoricola sp.]
MGIVNNAVYLNGVRTAVPPSLELTYETMDESGGMGWIGLYRPSKAEMDSVAEEFSLHHLVVEDSIKAHQRPKIERYGEVLFTVLRPARYVDSTERVEFGELHILTGENFVVTSRFAETPDLTVVRQRLEANPELLALGPEAVLYATLDQVVDEYFPVVAGLANDIDEIEYQVFGGDPKVSRRIYELLREVIEFQRATQPLTVMLDSLKNGFEKYAVDEELQKYLRDVEDHALKIIDRVDGFRSLLEIDD